MSDPAQTPELEEIVKALARMAEARDYAAASRGRATPRNPAGQPPHDKRFSNQATRR